VGLGLGDGVVPIVVGGGDEAVGDFELQAAPINVTTPTRATRGTGLPAS